MCLAWCARPNHLHREQNEKKKKKIAKIYSFFVNLFTAIIVNVYTILFSPAIRCAQHSHDGTTTFNTMRCGYEARARIITLLYDYV